MPGIKIQECVPALPVSGASLSAVMACANVDTITNSILVIEYDHHEVHQGSMFTVDWYPGDVSAAASANLFIVTPNTTKWAHIVPEVSSENESTFYIYEGASYASSGTQIVPINKNRNSSTVSTCFVNHTPSTPSISGATLIRTIHWGSSKAYGGFDRNALEFILKQNTTYLFQVVNNSGGASWTHIMLIWYEHTNKSFY